MKDKKIITTIPCDCRCCMIVVEKYEFDDTIEFGISTMDPYYRSYNGIVVRIKNAFKVLFGKPIYYNSAVISHDKMEEFVNDLVEML